MEILCTIFANILEIYYYANLKAKRKKMSPFPIYWVLSILGLNILSEISFGIHFMHDVPELSEWEPQWLENQKKGLPQHPQWPHWAVSQKQITHHHHILLRTREDNRNKGIKYPPNKHKTRYQHLESV